MRKRRRILQAIASIGSVGIAGCETGSDDTPTSTSTDTTTSISADTPTSTPTDTDSNPQTQTSTPPDTTSTPNGIPEHDHSGPESGGDSLQPSFASIEREPTHALLSEFVEGEGTWEAPYTSESGTGGLRELVDKYGPHTTIVAPTGVYSFTSAFETTTSDIRIIGEGNGHPEHDPTTDDQPRGTIFRLDYRPEDPKKGSIIHALGTQEAGADSMIFGWELRNFRIVNGTGGSFAEEAATATGMRLEWFPVNSVSEITIGGPFATYGFDRGILVNNMFKFTWSDINGKKNRIMIDSDGDVNQGVFRAIYSKPEGSGGDSAMLRLGDEIGRVENLAADKPRGLAIVGIGGDAARVQHGVVLEGAMGVDIYGPHIERSQDSAVLVDVTEDDVRSRSVGIYGGFFNDCDTAVEVRGGRRVLVDGPYIQTPSRTGRDTSAVSIGSMSEHTRLRRLSVHESVNTEVADSGTGTTRNGMGIISGSSGAPSTENWEPGDVVEVRGPSESTLYRLMADGERWYKLG